MKRSSIPVLVSVLILTSCATMDAPPPASASCFDKQKYCVASCQSNYESASRDASLSTIIAVLLVNPNPNQARRMKESDQATTNRIQGRRETCRSNCDTEGDICRRRAS